MTSPYEKFNEPVGLEREIALMKEDLAITSCALGICVDVLHDIAENGMRADMNPTQPMGDWQEVTKFYLSYLDRINKSLKLRAKVALDSIGPKDD